MSLNLDEQFDDGSPAPTRTAPPAFANAFGISHANNEVVCIDFVDSDSGSDRIFSSIAMTKSMTRNFANKLMAVIDNMDAKDDDQQTDR